MSAISPRPQEYTTSLKELNDTFDKSSNDNRFIVASTGGSSESISPISMRRFLSSFWVLLQNFPDLSDKAQVARFSHHMARVFPVKENRDEYKVLQALFQKARGRRDPNDRQALANTKFLVSSRQDLIKQFEGLYALKLPKNPVERIQKLKRTLSYLIMEQYIVSHFSSMAKISLEEVNLRNKLMEYLSQKEILAVDLSLYSLTHLKHIGTSEEFSLYLSYKKFACDSIEPMIRFCKHLMKTGVLRRGEFSRSFFKALMPLYKPSSSTGEKELKDIFQSSLEYCLAGAFLGAKLEELPAKKAWIFYVEEFKSDSSKLFSNLTPIASLLFNKLLRFTDDVYRDPYLISTASDVHNHIFLSTTIDACSAYPYFYPLQARRYEEAYKALKGATSGKKNGDLDLINKNPFSDIKDHEFPPTLQALKEEAPFSIKDILRELVLGKTPILKQATALSSVETKDSASTSAASSAALEPSLEIPLLYCEPKAFPFIYHARVQRWFDCRVEDMQKDLFSEYVESDDAYKKTMIQLHGFSQKADLFYHIGIKRDNFEKEDQTLYIIPAELSSDGTVLRGTVTYCIDEEGVCYHRFFTKYEKHGEMITKILENTFALSDFPELSKETQAYKVQAASRRADKVSEEDDFSIDPVFDFVTIHDKKLHLTLKLFPVNG